MFLQHLFKFNYFIEKVDSFFLVNSVSEQVFHVQSLTTTKDIEEQLTWYIGYTYKRICEILIKMKLL